MSHDEKFLRFSGGRRLTHWILVLSFFTLLTTGMFLIVPGLAHLAAGGTAGTVHRIFAIPFLLWPIIYLILDRKGLLEFMRESLVVRKDDLAWHLAMPQYILGFAKQLPPSGKANPGHKLHHVSIFLLYLAMGISGLFLWLGKGTLGADTFGLLILIHNLAMYAMVILTIGHVYFVFVYGALGGMLNGYVEGHYLKFEHRLWWEEIQREKSEQKRRSQSLGK